MVSTAAGSTAAEIASAPESAAFDYERFDVYRVALEFQGFVPGLLPGRGHAALRDQLDRASTSILLNIAEGFGRTSRAEKAWANGVDATSQCPIN